MQLRRLASAIVFSVYVHCRKNSPEKPTGYFYGCRTNSHSVLLNEC